MTPLEGALTGGLLSKDVELKGLPVGVFIFFLTCIVFSGEGGYRCLASYTVDLKILQNSRISYIRSGSTELVSISGFTPSFIGEVGIEDVFELHKFFVGIPSPEYGCHCPSLRQTKVIRGPPSQDTAIIESMG